MHKTKKSVSKRVKVTRSGKILRRTMGVSHFGTRKSSKSIRRKRKKLSLDATDARIFRKYLL